MWLFVSIVPWSPLSTRGRSCSPLSIKGRPWCTFLSTRGSIQWWHSLSTRGSIPNWCTFLSTRRIIQWWHYLSTRGRIPKPYYISLWPRRKNRHSWAWWWGQWKQTATYTTNLVPTPKTFPWSDTTISGHGKRLEQSQKIIQEETEYLQDPDEHVLNYPWHNHR